MGGCGKLPGFAKRVYDALRVNDELLKCKMIILMHRNRKIDCPGCESLDLDFKGGAFCCLSKGCLCSWSLFCCFFWWEFSITHTNGTSNNIESVDTTHAIILLFATEEILVL